jgi:hypothetical protein
MPIIINMAVPIIVSFYGLPMFTNGAGCDSLNLSLKLPFGLIDVEIIPHCGKLGW